MEAGGAGGGGPLSRESIMHMWSREVSSEGVSERLFLMSWQNWITSVIKEGDGGYLRERRGQHQMVVEPCNCFSLVDGLLDDVKHSQYDERAARGERL